MGLSLHNMSTLHARPRVHEAKKRRLYSLVTSMRTYEQSGYTTNQEQVEVYREQSA